MFTDHIHPHHPEHSEETHAHLDISLHLIRDELNDFNKSNDYTAEQKKNRILEAKKRAQRIKDILRAHVERMQSSNLASYGSAKKYLMQAIDSCDHCMGIGFSEHDHLDDAHLSMTKHFGDAHSHIHNAIGLLQNEHAITNGKHTIRPELYHHDLQHAVTHDSPHGSGGHSH